MSKVRLKKSFQSGQIPEFQTADFHSGWKAGIVRIYFISIKVAKLFYYAKKNNFSIPRSINIDKLIDFIAKETKIF